MNNIVEIIMHELLNTSMSVEAVVQHMNQLIAAR